jgi:hypothetical protein
VFIFLNNIRSLASITHYVLPVRCELDISMQVRVNSKFVKQLSVFLIDVY